MHLVDHRGEVVSIDSLLEAIWSGETAAPAYVRKAIHEIRAALEDDAGQIIKTLPKVGYLIDAEVLEEPGPTGRTSNRATASSERTLVYGRLSPGAYTGISRRLRESRKDTTS